MARIRTIKPEFWTSEQVAECSPTARLLFIGLWNFCDDAGRHPDSAMRIKMQVFPADAMTVDDIEVLLGELIDAELLQRYSSEGKDYIQVTGWHHQRIDKPQVRYPSPNGSGTVADRSENGHPRNGVEGIGMEGNVWSTSEVEGDQMRGELSEEQIGIARQRIAEVVNRVGPPRKPADTLLNARCAILTLKGPFTEAWLYGAAEGTRVAGDERKRTPYAYFTDCLKDGAEKLGCPNLVAVLRKVKVPQVLLRPPPNSIDRSERACKKPPPE